jgi:hypothetical protein
MRSRPTDTAVFVEQTGGQGGQRRASAARAEDDGEELGVAEGFDPCLDGSLR